MKCDWGREKLEYLYRKRFDWTITEPGVSILYADVSEHSICSIFIGRRMKCDWRREKLEYLYRKRFDWKIGSAIFQSYLLLCKYSSFSLLQSHFILLPMKMEQIECSETSAYKIETPGNYPKENIM
jgi:uncharacterized protein (DUF2132 family)